MSIETTAESNAQDRRLTASAVPVKFLQPVFLPFVLSRVCILFTSIVLDWMLDSGKIVRYAYILHAPLATLSGTFDANWYADVAANGYSNSPDVSIQQNYHFFPLYPLVMRGGGWLFGLGNVAGGYNIAGVIINHIFFLVALALLYHLTKEMLGDTSLAKYSVWTMAFLPWSFVFSMAYTEALCLLLSLLAIMLSFQARIYPRMSQLLWISLLTMLASQTRGQGIVVVVPVIIYVAFAPPGLQLLTRLRNIATVTLPAIGSLVAFQVYISITTGNFLAGLKVNHTWGSGWYTELHSLFVLPPANPISAQDILATIALVMWLVVLGFLAYYALAMKGIFERTTGGRWSVVWPMSIYAFTYFIFTATVIPTNSSWGRYLLMVPACIWIVAALCRKLAQRISVRTLIVAGAASQVLLFSAAVILRITP